MVKNKQVRNFSKIELKGESKVHAEWSQLETIRTKDRSTGELVSATNKKTLNKEPHHNFYDAMQRMIPHAMFKTGFASPETDDREWFIHEFLDDERFEGIKCTGIVIGKNEETVKIMFEKECPDGDGQVSNHVSPVISLLDVGELNYRFLQIIRDQLQDVIAEADSYFDGTKYAITQLKAEL